VTRFTIDLAVDQLLMTGTYLAGDYEGTFRDKVVVDAFVEGDLLHAEGIVSELFESAGHA
jgi:hypothetical protein